jgi:hypothetical protein
MAVNKDELAAMMGEENIVRPKMQQYPIIRLQGNKGEFMRLDVGKDGYEKPKAVGQIIEGEIIAVRRQLSEYSKNYTRSSNEFDSPLNEIIVWERGATGGAGEIFRGSYKDAREKFQTLRSRYLLYMMQGEDVVKVVVKGAGLKHLFEYLAELRKNDRHLFEVKTRIQPAQESNDAGMSYYAMHFSNAAEVDEVRLEGVAAKLKGFHEVLKQLREMYAKKVADPAAEEIPVVQLEEEGEEEELPDLHEPSAGPHPFN